MKIGHKTYLDGDAQNLQMFYGCFMVISSHFFKKSVQTVILRCLSGLNVNWFKSYNRKRKHFRFRCFAILQKIPNFCVFCVFKFLRVFICVTTFEPIKVQTHSVPQNYRLNLLYLKDIQTICKKMARHHRKMAINHLQILDITLQHNRC